MTTQDKWPKGGLQDLIAEHKGDRSYQTMADQSGDPSRVKMLQKLATTPRTEFPKAESIELLAQVLRVPVATVVNACAISVGMDMRPTSGADLVIPGAGRITREAREVVQELVDLLPRTSEPDLAASEDLPAVFDLAAEPVRGLQDSQRRDAVLPSPEDEDQSDGQGDDPA